METEQPLTEAVKVERWRLHVLLEGGWPLELAERVAASSADLHLAVDLLTAGCPADTALRIVL